MPKITIELDQATARAVERVLRHGFVSLGRDVASLSGLLRTEPPGMDDTPLRDHVRRDRMDLRLTAPTLERLGSAIEASGGNL